MLSFTHSSKPVDRTITTNTYPNQLNTDEKINNLNIDHFFTNKKVKGWIAFPTIAASLALGSYQIELPTHSNNYATDLTERAPIESNQTAEEQFLLRNPATASFIESGKEIIQNITGSKDISLEYFNDPDEKIEKLFMNILLSDEMFEKSTELEDLIFKKWFLKVPKNIQKNLVISLI